MTNNKRILGSILLPLGIVAVAGGSAQAKKSKAPNVLFIIADDLGWNDLACYGSQYYETPNLDRLAQQGVLFSNAYAACQVSSPSRASVMTGKYPANHGITDWIGAKAGTAWRSKGLASKMLPADYARALSADESTIAEYLQSCGYTTFMAGKWHLGDEGSWPEDHGFQINKGGWSVGSPKGGYFSPWQNPRLENKEDGESLSMRLGQETIDFMREHQKKNKNTPFFAYLSYYAVHGPLETTEELWNKFRDKADSMGINEGAGFKVDRTRPVRQQQDNPVYAGVLNKMDESIGMVLDALEQMGLDENTLVIFTSDNGGVVSGDSYSTCLLPLRGGKGRQFEGGIRVPLLVRAPGNEAYAATTCDVPVSGIDYYSTIVDYANLPANPAQEVDGVSIMPLLSGGEIASRPLFWHYPHYGNQGGEPSSIIRDGDWKLIHYHESSNYELYNLAIDITECEPLNHTAPEKLAELKGKLHAWLKESNAKMPEGDPKYSPQKEQEVKQKWATATLTQFDQLRLKMLSPDWSPNDTWWDSSLAND
ncbi:MAG: sulfatase [Rikenellaceae bacterium]